MQNKPKFYQCIRFIARLAFFVFILFAIWNLLNHKGEQLGDILTHFKAIHQQKLIFFGTFVLLLMPLNWALEARKWQVLSSKIQKISFQKAYQNVLASTTLGYLTPLGVGDWIVKINSFDAVDRKKSVGAVILGGGVQVFVSWFCGAVALTCFIIQQPILQHLASYVVLGLLYAGLLFGFWVLWQRNKLSALVAKYPLIRRLEKYFAIIQTYEPAAVFSIFLLTALRYSTFVSQMLLLFYLFGIQLPLQELLVGAVLVFFVKAIMPLSDFLSDLGMRELTALYYFNFYNISPSLVAGASLSLWGVNIFIPMLFGGFFLIKNKFLG